MCRGVMHLQNISPVCLRTKHGRSRNCDPAVRSCTSDQLRSRPEEAGHKVPNRGSAAHHDSHCTVLSVLEPHESLGWTNGRMHTWNEPDMRQAANAVFVMLHVCNSMVAEECLAASIQGESLEGSLCHLHPGLKAGEVCLRAPGIHQLELM